MAALCCQLTITGFRASASSERSFARLILTLICSLRWGTAGTVRTAVLRSGGSWFGLSLDWRLAQIIPLGETLKNMMPILSAPPTCNARVRRVSAHCSAVSKDEVTASRRASSST